MFWDEQSEVLSYCTSKENAPFGTSKAKDLFDTREFVLQCISDWHCCIGCWSYTIYFHHTKWYYDTILNVYIGLSREWWVLLVYSM